MAPSLWVELVLSTILVLATALFHGFGLLVIGRALSALDRGRTEFDLNPLSLRGTAYTSAVVLGLLTTVRSTPNGGRATG